MAVWLTMSLSQGTPNETARTNTVTATVTVHYSGGSYNGNSPSGTVTINGQSSSFTCNFNYAGIGQGAVTTGTGSVVAATRTVTVSYGSSSTKTVSASASFNSGTASGTVSTSGSINLTPISAGGSSGGGDDDDDNTEEWNPDNPGSGSGGSTPNVGNCTNILQSYIYYEQEEVAYDDRVLLKVSNYDYMPFVAFIRFNTPEFSGVSTSLDVSLCPRGYTGNLETPMYHALCTSDYNHNKYLESDLNVYDPNIIARGSMKLEDYFSPFSIQTDKLKGNTTYYLIFWMYPHVDRVPSSSYEGEAAPYQGITVNYTSSGGDSGGDDSGGGDDVVTPSTRGVFYISNDSEYVEYEYFIKNGTGWNLVGGGSTGESEYYRKEGTVTTNSDGTPVSVNCGFTPDLVVLHLNENDSGAEFSSAASFDVHNGPVITVTYSLAMNGNVALYVDRDDQGFLVISYFENPGNPFSLTLNYTAIKYT